MILSYPPSIIKSIYPSLTWEIETEEPNIYLTFDDGPTPGVTEKVLSMLKEYNASATFFCLGKNIKENPELFENIVQAGHAIGNHTYSHLNGWKNTTVDFLNDIKSFDQVYQTNLFRPPYGKIKSTQIAALKGQYQIIMWSILTYDYDQSIEKESCLEIALKNLRQGSIIVFHDSHKASRNMFYALKGILEYANDYGFECKAIN